MKNWVKLNLFYMGKSKKNQIFRVKNWNKALEKVANRPVFTESYEKIGFVKEIFGPIDLPFISINATSEHEFNPHDKFYVKID